MAMLTSTVEVVHTEDPEQGKALNATADVFLTCDVAIRSNTGKAAIPVLHPTFSFLHQFGRVERHQRFEARPAGW